MPRDRLAPTVQELEVRTYLSAAPLATQLITQVSHEIRAQNAAIFVLNGRLTLEEKAEAWAAKRGLLEVETRLNVAISTTNNLISTISTQSNARMDVLQELAEDYQNATNEISSLLENIAQTQAHISQSI